MMMSFNHNCKVRSLEAAGSETDKSASQAEATLQLCLAHSFFAKARGLIGVTRLDPATGLWLPSCNNIHMWFMSLSLDVLFFRRDSVSSKGISSGLTTGVITSIREGVKPWTLLPLMDGRATDTIELGSGTVARLGIRSGDTLCIS